MEPQHPFIGSIIELTMRTSQLSPQPFRGELVALDAKAGTITLELSADGGRRVFDATNIAELTVVQNSQNQTHQKRHHNGIANTQGSAATSSFGSSWHPYVAQHDVNNSAPIDYGAAFHQPYGILSRPGQYEARRPGFDENDSHVNASGQIYKQYTGDYAQNSSYIAPFPAYKTSLQHSAGLDVNRDAGQYSAPSHQMLPIQSHEYTLHPQQLYKPPPQPHQKLFNPPQYGRQQFPKRNAFSSAAAGIIPVVSNGSRDAVAERNPGSDMYALSTQHSNDTTSTMQRLNHLTVVNSHTKGLSHKLSRHKGKLQKSSIKKSNKKPSVVEIPTPQYSILSRPSNSLVNDVQDDVKSQGENDSSELMASNAKYVHKTASDNISKTNSEALGGRLNGSGNALATTIGKQKYVLNKKQHKQHSKHDVSTTNKKKIYKPKLPMDANGTAEVAAVIPSSAD